MTTSIRLRTRNKNYSGIFAKKQAFGGDGKKKAMRGGERGDKGAREGKKAGRGCRKGRKFFKMLKTVDSGRLRLYNFGIKGKCNCNGAGA